MKKRILIFLMLVFFIPANVYADVKYLCNNQSINDSEIENPKERLEYMVQIKDDKYDIENFPLVMEKINEYCFDSLNSNNCIIEFDGKWLGVRRLIKGTGELSGLTAKSKSYEYRVSVKNGKMDRIYKQNDIIYDTLSLKKTGNILSYYEALKKAEEMYLD